MHRAYRILPAPVRRVGRRVIDAVRARRAWNRMLRLAMAGPDPLRSVAEGPEDEDVCLLAWYFPPTVTGGSYRPAALARYGTEAGLPFTVISGPLYEDPSAAGRYLARKIPSDVQVVRCPPPDLRPLDGALPALDGGALNTLETWRAVRHSFPAGAPSLIFATGPPFHTFVAGYLAATSFGVPLVLEYRDEWTECPFDFVQTGPADRRWEETCLAAAERVIFTTRSQREHQLASFPGLDRERCVVIPNGWEPEDAIEPVEVDTLPLVTEDRRVISFAGNLGNHTLPGSFLDCLDEAMSVLPDLADRLKFVFVGQKSRQATAELSRFAVSSLIESRDQIPKREVGRILRRSSGLLLLNPPELERYIPGKLYEYLAAGRPVLVYGAGGEAGALVERLEAGHVVGEGDAPGLAAALERIAGQSGNEPQISAARAEWLERHTRRLLALRTVDVLRAVRDV